MTVFRPYKLDQVTIVGLGKSSYDLISFQHQYFKVVPNSQVWTINAGGYLYRHDVLWDMHTKEYLDKIDYQPALDRREWLKNHDKPVVMAKADANIPTSFTYPLREVIDTLQTPYFLTSVGYMLAFAMLCEVKSVRLYGVDFDYGPGQAAHEVGRPCAEFWLGRMVERGIKVEVTTNTTLLGMTDRAKGKLYGYEQPAEFEFPIEGGKPRFIGPDYDDLSVSPITEVSTVVPFEKKEA